MAKMVFTTPFSGWFIGNVDGVADVDLYPKDHHLSTCLYFLWDRRGMFNACIYHRRITVGFNQRSDENSGTMHDGTGAQFSGCAFVKYGTVSIQHNFSILFIDWHF
jgi:hypothetical protein